MPQPSSAARFSVDASLKVVGALAETKLGHAKICQPVRIEGVFVDDGL